MRAFGWFALLLLFVSPAFAGTDQTIPLDNGAQAKITVSSCFPILPSSGYAPITININNDSARAQSWDFLFKSPAFGFVLTNSIDFSTELTVQSKSTRSFKLLIPLAFRATEYFISPLNVIVSGPGASARSTVQFPTGKRTGKLLTPFVALSDSLGAASQSQLEKELGGSAKEDFFGTTFVPNELPDDWRGLIGVAGMWISNNELNGLSPTQRGALHDWVTRGGSLFICGVPEVNDQFADAGFGTVTAVPEPALDIGDTVAAIGDLRSVNMEEQLNQAYNSWKATLSVGPIILRASLLTGFMALFAIVVGPVNLFVFAGRVRRHRLFWTTPLISIVASVLLLALIVFQDGFGGSGMRMALVHVSPVDNKVVLVQEQVSRAGVLLGSAFSTREPCFIAPIALDSRRTAPKRKYKNSDNYFAGEWFLSRTVQAHWLESIAPGRADVVLTNAADVENSNAAPVIISNIVGTLDQLYFLDDTWQVWSAKNVRTGQKVALVKTSEIPELLPAEAGARLQTLWQRVHRRTGYFYAVASNSPSLVDTLPSIRWRDNRVIFLGPLAGAAPRS